MKKLLTVSLVAMMAVSAARADIASTDFVTKQTGDITGLATTNKSSLTAAVNEVAGIAGAAATKDALDALTGTVASNKTAIEGTVSALSTKVDGIDTAYKAADTTLTNKFGDLGTQTVKEYVDEKTADIATNDTVTALGTRVTTAEGKIVTLTGAADVDGSVANAKKAGTDAATALDQYKTAVSSTYATQVALTEGLSGKQATLTAGSVARGLLADDVQTSLGLADSALQEADISDMQVKSNIHTTGKLEGTALNTKYPSVGYVDNKVASIDTDLTGIKGRLTSEESATTTMKGQLADISESLAEGGDTANAIAAAKKAGDDAQADLDAYKESNDAAVAGKQATLTGDQLAAVNSGITGAKVSTYDGYSALITAAQGKADANATSIGEMDLAEVSSDGMAIVSISEENGKVAAATGTIKNAGIAADAGIEQSKIAGLVTDLGAKLDKSALTGASKAGTDETGTADGVYTLTMKVAGDVQTYVWEKIAR